MRYTHKTKHLWLTAFVLLVVLHLCVFTAYRVSKNAESWSDVIIPDASSKHPPGKTRVGSAKPSSHLSSGSGRVIYPNSVIRGGVRSQEEFKAALLKDSVVAAHFSDFRAARSRLIDLKGDKAAYVSYRIGDKVYWTKKRVRLSKGEKLITDGVNYARSRCGNRISEVSQAPTSAEEPAHALLDMPIPTDEKDPLLLGAMPKPAGGLPDQMRPSAFGFVPGSRSRLPGFLIPGIVGGGAVAGRGFGSGGGRTDIPVPPIPPPPNPLPTADVPEPSTWIFLVSGLGSAIAFRRRIRR